MDHWGCSRQGYHPVWFDDRTPADRTVYSLYWFTVAYQTHGGRVKTNLKGLFENGIPKTPVFTLLAETIRNDAGVNPPVDDSEDDQITLPSKDSKFYGMQSDMFMKSCWDIVILKVHTIFTWRKKQPPF